jgi:hypothetical protein
VTFVYGALTLYGAPSQTLPLAHNLCNSPTALWCDQERSYNPMPATPTGYRSGTVWADPVSLATTQGIEVSLFSSGY